MALTARIQKRYGNFLLDVDFSAGSGESLALLGASGCGKSVSLRCLAGIDRPDWGHIELDGQVLYDGQRHINLPPQQRRVGYLFQQYALFPHMTVEENIAVCLRQLPRSQRRQRAAELISQLRLEGTERLRPHQLSGGQQQRAALARILASDPAAILLDEPLAALDSCLKRQLEEELRDVLDAFGGPVIWVSHDRGEVYRSCRRVCVLDSGKSSQVTGFEELLTAPGTVSAARISGCEVFVPFLPGPEAGTISIPSWNLVLPAPWREGASILGVRPECVKPSADGFPCQIVRITEDISSVRLSLHPLGAARTAPLLQMELSKSEWTTLPNQKTIHVSIPAESLLLLRE